MMFHWRFLRLYRVLILSLLGTALDGSAQTGPYESNAYVETIAGSRFIGHVDGQSVNTMFSYPTALTVDSHTNVYVWDAGNRAIRRIDESNNVTTLSSNFYNGVYSLSSDGNELLVLGYTGNSGDNMTLWWVSHSGSINRVRTLTTEGNDSHPGGLVKTAKGIFFTSQNRVYILTNDVVAVFVGSGNAGTVDGQGVFCSFNRPLALAVDAADNLYVGQPYGIRKITPEGVVTTILETSDLNALTVNPEGVVCWNTTFQIKKIFNQLTTQLGGTNFAGFSDGESVASVFFAPQGIGFGPDHKLYVADTGNRRIRRIMFNPIPAFQLGVELKPTVILNGPIGRTYRIESRDSVSEQWNSLESVTLTSSPQVWLDQRPFNSQRFYRTVEQP